MSLIIDVVTTHLPNKRKTTPSGWISFNAVCCHHMGTSHDTRQRGGIMINEGVSYHCFNCGFKSSWQPGRIVTSKFRKLLRWLNVDDDIINKCVIEALRSKEDSNYQDKTNLFPKFIDKLLPINSKKINDWLKEDIPSNLYNVVNYSCERGLDPIQHDFYYSNELLFRNRLIIPFYYKDKIVGWTARCINGTKPKYLSEQQPGFVFNLDKQTTNRKYVIVCEGPMDALSIDGVAILGGELNNQQISLINQLDREVILLPDRDKSGIKLAKQALELGWSISFPDWHEDIKDANDALNKYGRLSTLYNIIKHKEKNRLKIQLNFKKWFKE